VETTNAKFHTVNQNLHSALNAAPEDPLKVSEPIVVDLKAAVTVYVKHWQCKDLHKCEGFAERSMDPLFKLALL